MRGATRNFVNVDDLRRVGRKLRVGGVSEALGQRAGRSRDRVVRQWEGALDLPPTQWWAIPACRRRWNEKISGDPDVDFPQWVADRFLAGRSGLRAISVGCGHGGRERRWAELGIFERIDGYDLAPRAIEQGRAEVREAGLEDVLHLHVADVSSIEIAPGSYDVAMGLHSLHHFSPVRGVLRALARALRSDGLLVVDDYVGPTRFQWTPRQLEAADGLLRALPERYRVVDGGRVVRRIARPSRLAMIVDDPSEAVEAELIVPAIHDLYEVIEERPYGGSILQLTLSNISQHFLGDDELTGSLLDICFAVEDALMAEGEVGSDFTALVARPRTAAGGAA